MVEKWIIQREGKVSSPMSTEQVKSLAESGQLQPTDLIKKVGTSRAIPAGQIKGLFPTASQLKPPTDEAIPSDIQSLLSLRALLTTGGFAATIGLIALGAFTFRQITLDSKANAQKIALATSDSEPLPSESASNDTAEVSKLAPNPPTHNQEPESIKASPNKNAATANIEAASENAHESAATGSPEAPGMNDESKPNNVKSRGERPPSERPHAPLTADEIELLQLSSRADRTAPTRKVKNFMPVVEDPPPYHLSQDEINQLLIREIQAAGRGKEIGVRLLAKRILELAMYAESAQFEAGMAQIPSIVKDCAIQSVGLALQGKDVPPLNSREFKAMNSRGLNLIDGLRKNKARESELRVTKERLYFTVTTAIEKDLMPALGTNPIAKEHFPLRRGSGGQSLHLKYMGSQPLTNVVLISLVQQSTDRSAEATRKRTMVDLFNRSFGATDEQASDAQRYLLAEDIYWQMPKFASKFVKSVSNGQEINFEVGDMQRGKALDGNTNSLAIYCDQGRISSCSTREFPELPDREDAAVIPIELGDDGSLKYRGVFKRANSGKPDSKHVAQVLRIKLVEGATYKFTVEYHGKTSPSVRIAPPQDQPLNFDWSKPNFTTVENELTAVGGNYLISCTCPVSDLSRYSLTVRRLSEASSN